jgi:hypothetical protein
MTTIDRIFPLPPGCPESPFDLGGCGQLFAYKGSGPFSAMFDRELWRTPVASLSDERVAKIPWGVGYSYVFILEKLAVRTTDGWQEQNLPTDPDDRPIYAALAERGRDCLRCTAQDAIDFAEREVAPDARVLVARVVDDIPWY